MKNTLLTFMAVIVLTACADAPTKENQFSEKINQVESNLSTQVFIKGDDTWTIEERMAHYGVPGVSIAVINDGAIEWVKTYGIMDKESKDSVTVNTLFQAASISKPVTAYGALRLVDQGKVSLTENINTYLTSWKLEDNTFTEQKKVNIKNLLNHSAGVTVHGFLGYSPGLPVPNLTEVLNGLPPANSGRIYVDKEPETSYRYSGGGYNIIQQMMIDQEGKEFPEIMNELVLEPLEMDNSTYNQPLSAQQLPMAATGYLPDGSEVNGKRHTYPEMAPAGLWTTATDLAKFAVQLQKTLKEESGIGLSKDLTAQMLTPFVEDFIGLGIFLDKRNEEIYFGHGGWNEGFSSEMVAHKDKGYGVVILTNSNHPPFISELIRSVAITYNWKDYVPTYDKMQPNATDLAEIPGRYKINDNLFVEVTQKDNRLFGKELGQQQSELFKVTDSTFVRRENNRHLYFRKNPENTPMEMQVINVDEDKILGRFQKMNSEEKLAIEYLMEGEFETALAAYQAKLALDKNDPMVDENNLNNLGYQFLGNDQVQLAHDVFKVNMLLYPVSFNAYDSYAEACMMMGLDQLAITNYTKSLELNPENTNATQMIKRIHENNE